MNKLFPVAASVLAASVLFTTPALAVDSPAPSGSPRWVFNQEVKQANQAFHQNVEQARDERKTNITQARLDMIVAVAKLHASRLQNQFARHELWLSNIAGRIQSRVNALKAKGIDVTAMQNALNTATAEIATATTDGSNAVAAFNNISGTTLEAVRASVQNAISLAEQTRKDFNQARQDLVQAFQLIRAGTPHPSESPKI